MEIPKDVLKLLNEQFYNELHAAHIYFGMGAFFKRSPFAGFAKWMELQAKEEIEHAMKIYNFLCERDAPFAASEIAKPKKDIYDSPLDAFKAAYEHEKLVTSQITRIFELANERKDYATADLMNWFINEQVEEEHNTLQFVKALEFAGADKNLIIGVDKWAGKRAE